MRWEQLRNANLAPLTYRLKRAVHFILDPHIHSAPDCQSEHYRPSVQRDVGKTAREAAGVQLVLEGLQEPMLPIIERPDAAQLDRTVVYIAEYRRAMLERLNQPDDAA